MINEKKYDCLKITEKSDYALFYALNIETGKVNVIYRLKDSSNFGLVEPEN